MTEASASSGNEWLRTGPRQRSQYDWIECCFPSCSKKPLDTARVPMCWDHLLAAWRDFNAEIEAAKFDSLERRADQLLELGAALSQSTVDGVVYFVRFRDRIKIGHTTNLRQRLRAFPVDEVLLTIPGSVEDEARCHAAFAHLRVQGEWFTEGPELLAFIRSLSDRAA